MVESVFGPQYSDSTIIHCLKITRLKLYLFKTNSFFNLSISLSQKCHTLTLFKISSPIYISFKQYTNDNKKWSVFFTWTQHCMQTSGSSSVAKNVWHIPVNMLCQSVGNENEIRNRQSGKKGQQQHSMAQICYYNVLSNFRTVRKQEAENALKSNTSK